MAEFDPERIPGYTRLADNAWKAERELNKKARIVADTIPGRRFHRYNVENPAWVQKVYEEYRVAAVAAERAVEIRDQCYDAYTPKDDEYEIWVDRDD